MSYVSEAFESETCTWEFKMREETQARRNSAEHAFQDGLRAGFEVALRAYGIWRGGRQVIGASDTPIAEILAKECTPATPCTSGENISTGQKL